MLKGIPKIISPELMKTLMEMGHGDEIVIADGNFPAESVGKKVIRCDGTNVKKLLEAVIKFFPLDIPLTNSVGLMKVQKGYSTKPVIWETYKEIIEKEHNDFGEFEMIERFDFYKRAEKAYAVIATHEEALYANIILKKGVV